MKCFCTTIVLSKEVLGNVSIRSICVYSVSESAEAAKAYAISKKAVIYYLSNDWRIIIVQAFDTLHDWIKENAEFVLREK